MRLCQHGVSYVLLIFFTINTAIMAVEDFAKPENVNEENHNFKGSSNTAVLANSIEETQAEASLGPTVDTNPPSQAIHGTEPAILESSPASWADNSFRYRKNITVDHNQVSTDLTDFPMLIDLYDGDLQQYARVDGRDILFTDPSGIKLTHEIELYDRTYNATHAHLVAWVRANLSSSLDTIIQLYFGKSVTRYQENPDEVWTDYEGVWHLAEASGSGSYIKDSTTSNHDGTPTGTQFLGSGKIGGARNFTGSANNRIEMNSGSTVFDGNSIFTFSFWIYPDYPSDPWQEKGVFHKSSSVRMARLLASGKFQADIQFASYGTVYANVAINCRQWSYITYCYDGTDLKQYVNDQNVGTTNIGSDSLLADNSIFYLGATDSFPGFLDEFRISYTSRSLDWVATEFANQNATTAFYGVEVKEKSPESENWALPLMRYRKNITIDASKVNGTGSLTSFPVLIDLNDTDLHDSAKVQADGDDIAFTDASGTKLDHEIEFFDQNANSTHGHLIAWVRIPSLSATTNTNITMYYGNNEVRSQANPEGVWGTDYAGVWHLKETPPGTINDSTVNNNDGTPSTNMAASNQVAGKIDGSIAFSETDSDQIDVGDVDSNAWTAITVETWVYHTEDDDDRVICKSLDGTAANHIFSLQLISGGTLRVRMSTDGSGGSPGSNKDSDGIVGLNAWHHIAFTWDSATETIYLYIDGAQDYNNYSLNGDSIADSSLTVVIGNLRPADERYYSGMIDEARISKAARSADWMGTQFTNQNDPSSFFWVGVEETYSGWWADGSFTRRKDIVIDHEKVAGHLIDFPVLLNITDSAFKSGNLQPDFDDILFADANQTKLAHEIEYFSQTGSNGHLIAWVRIPTLTSAVDTVLSMYYGNKNLVSQEIPEAVWNSNYQVVHHMEETPLQSIPAEDSTSNDNDMTPVGQMSQDDIENGQIGNAVGFDGINDRFISTRAVQFNSFTFSAWFQQGTESNGWRALYSVGAAPADFRWFGLYDQQVALDDGSTYTFGNSLATGTLYHAVVTWNGTTLRGYINGTEAGDYSIAGWSSMSANWWIASYGSSDYFNGTIDEIRILNTAHSADWITTEYNNQNDTASFFFMGPEIIFDSTAPVVNDFGVDDDGTGNPQFWAAVSDWPSVVASVTINVSNTEYAMSLNSTGYWIYTTSAVSYTDFVTYQILNASDVYENYLSGSTIIKSYTLTYDTVAPDVIDGGYDPDIGEHGLFNANVTDPWGIVDAVVVNVTYAAGIPQNSLTAILRPTASGYINDTLSVPRGRINYEFIVNDTAGNTFVSSEFQGWAGKNVAPNVLNVILSPSPLLSNDTLTLSYDFSDPENDSEGGTQIRWYKNGVLQPIHNDSLIIPGSALIKGDQWNASVTPKDGRDFGNPVWSPTITVHNVAPQILALDFINHTYAAFLVEDEDLQVSYTFSDADGDNDSSTIRWYRNDLHLQGFDTMTIIPASETLSGEVWHFELLPFDGTDSGSLVQSQSMTIESRPTIHEYKVIPQEDNEGHYEFWAQVSDPRNPIAEVQFQIFSETHWAQNNGTYWVLDYSFSLAYLNSSTTITCTAISNVQSSNDEIPASITFNVTIADQAPPRVIDCIYYWDDSNPVNITFIAEIEEYGSGIAEVILYYYFGSVSEIPTVNETISSPSNYDQLLSGNSFSAGLQNEQTSSGFKNATMQPLNATHWGITVPFNPTSNVDVFFKIFVMDNAGNSNPNAFPLGLDSTWGKSFTIEGSEGLDLIFVLGLLAIVALVFAIGSVIAIRMWRTTELVGLDKERVIASKGVITEEEISSALDLHTVGIVVSLFDQRHGPVPIIIVPELLKDNFDKLVELSDQAFSTCQFLNNFDTEVFANFIFVLGQTAQVNSISFAFALERPNARGGAENITLNILVHPNVFPLINQFVDHFSLKVHEIHVMMDKSPSEKDKILDMITNLRKEISYVVLSYERLYGTTELLAEEKDIEGPF